MASEISVDVSTLSVPAALPSGKPGLKTKVVVFTALGASSVKIISADANAGCTNCLIFADVDVAFAVAGA